MGIAVSEERKIYYERTEKAMRLHYLQHVRFENPGSILMWAKENGYVVTNTQLYENGSLPKQQDFDWLVIMGGPMNIYDEAIYP